MRDACYVLWLGNRVLFLQRVRTLHSYPMNLLSTNLQAGLWLGCAIALSPITYQDWQLRVESSLPQPAFVETVFRVGATNLNAAGYDMGSGAWYRYLDGRAWGHIPGVGTFSGQAGSKLTPSPGADRDPVVEHMIFPFILMRRVLDRPESVVSAQRDGDRWKLVVSSPERAGGEATAIELDSAGNVTAVGIVGSPDLLFYPDGAPEGYAIGFLKGLPVAVTIDAATVKPPGTAIAPAFRLKDIEELVNHVRSREAELRIARSKENATVQPSLAPGEAFPGGPIRAAPEKRYGPAFLVAGVVVVLVGGFAWWRRRGD